MTDIAIKVENLSKRYRIGVAEERHDTLVSATLAGLRPSLRNLQRLRSLATFKRLAFAVAAHLEPEILLVDEVLAVGGNPCNIWWYTHR